MALRVFTELSHLAPVAREGAMLEAGLASRALKGAFGEAVAISHAGGAATVTLKGAQMPLARFMERVLAEDATILKTLETEMGHTAYKELSSAVTAAKGMSRLSEQSFHMMSGIRSSLDDLAESLRVLKTENGMTAGAFENALKESAKQSAKSAKLLKTYEKLGSKITTATRMKTAIKITGKVFAYVILPGAGALGIYEFLLNYAAKNSGCYILCKSNSVKSRVAELSKGMGLKAAHCGGCNLTHETVTSTLYNNFRNSGKICDPELCKLESLEPPHNDRKLYEMTCLELDAADALADIASGIAGGIAPAIIDFTYNFTKKMAPFAAVAGLGYLGFVYITTRGSARPVAMNPSTPYYMPLDEGPKRKKSTSGYPGPLKKSHP